MEKENYKLIAQSIWRSGCVIDKNKVRQQAKEDIRRLIAIDLASSLAHENPNFDEETFYKDCNVSVNF